MPTWTSLEDRKIAATAFAAALARDPALRQQCTENSDVARETFGSVGDMNDIPKDVTFRVFEESDPARDKLVVIVLPDSAPIEGEEPEFDVLRCTRPPH